MKDYWLIAFVAVVAICVVIDAILRASRERQGATAICIDGWLSYSANPCGTCSSHGGVATWLFRPA
jgi:hypothetical protein